jgi:DNA invertase Pin-like site-specific DNA recombinase
MFFNILATFAEFEVDQLRLRTREGMAVARAKGKLRGKQPKLTARQQAELTRMHATGEYTIADFMEVFSVGRATVYRTLERAGSGALSAAASYRARPSTPVLRNGGRDPASAGVIRPRSRRQLAESRASRDV